MCSIGNLQARDFMYAYEMNRSRVPGGGLLMDPWVNPGDPSQEVPAASGTAPRATNEFTRQ
jgi:hypothetical protein